MKNRVALQPSRSARATASDEPSEASRAPLDAVLIVAVGVDSVLPVLAFVRPAWWFDVLHVGLSPDSLHVAFLQRAAARWVAFALVQIVALGRWRREPAWLLVVAGARTSDWLTDLTYLATMPSASSASWVLLAPPLMNAAMSLTLAYAWRELASPAPARP